ncbi:hypothetical protein LTR94_030577, partial [Friedmanniomyces endolithicus]
GDELVVGPYQGTLGCLRIPFGRGVCGAAAKTRETQIVEDVHAFPGHIACDSRSASEIVVPVLDAAGGLIAVLDVDATETAAFDAVDAAALERLMAKIETAALDASGAFAARIREPNPGTYDAALNLVADLIARVEAETGPARSVGLAIPGSPSPRTGLIRNANSTYLNGRRFGDDLEAALGRPVRLANDANCL